MSNGSRWLLSLLAAALIPILLPTIYFSLVLLQHPYPSASGLFLVTIVALTATLGHLAFLGIPGLLLLYRYRQFKAWTVCLLGFVLGCLPMSIFSWPVKPGRSELVSKWDGEKMVSAIVEATPTLATWIDYSEGVLSMGAFGLASSAAFWLIWWLTGLTTRHQEVGLTTPANL